MATKAKEVKKNECHDFKGILTLSVLLGVETGMIIGFLLMIILTK